MFRTSLLFCRLLLLYVVAVFTACTTKTSPTGDETPIVSDSLIQNAHENAVFGVGDTLAMKMAGKADIYLFELKDLSKDLVPTGAVSVFFGVDDAHGRCLILYSINDSVLVVEREAEYDDDIVANYHCRHPFVGVRGDTVYTECELYTRYMRDFFLLTKTQFKHVRSEEEDPNAELREVMEKATDGLSYCSQCEGMQNIGADGYAYCVEEGMNRVSYEVDSLVRIGKQREADSLISVFEADYLNSLFVDENKFYNKRMEDGWNELKTKRKEKLDVVRN